MPKDKIIKAWAVMCGKEIVYPLFKTKEGAEDWAENSKEKIVRIEIKILKK
jgi:hypothetical protein